MGWFKKWLGDKPPERMSDMALAKEYNLSLSKPFSEQGRDVLDAMERSGKLREELERRGYDIGKIIRAFTDKEVYGSPVRLHDCKQNS